MRRPLKRPPRKADDQTRMARVASTVIMGHGAGGDELEPNHELREDGSFELREDGGFELRE